MHGRGIYIWADGVKYEVFPQKCDLKYHGFMIGYALPSIPYFYS